MAGVVATSLHPVNLVSLVTLVSAKWTQTFRGARIACASWQPLFIYTLALCKILLDVRVSTSDEKAKDRGGKDEKGKIMENDKRNDRMST